MESQHVQQEITIIKKMIAKTRKDTAESGLFIIAIGIFFIIVTFVLGMLEFYNLNHLVLPVLVAVSLVSAVIGYLTVSAQQKQKRVTSYSKTIYYRVWFACAVPALMITFLFPLLKVYPWSLVPVLTSLIMGIALFATGSIFDSRFVLGSSTAWWVGAIILVFVDDLPRVLTMMTIILLGWVLPGLYLNRQYKNRDKENES